MDKIKEKLLFDFKKSNKTRRLQLAKKFGFSTSEEYLAYLTNNIIVEIEADLPAKEKAIIHNVILSDASGSMDGTKYSRTIEGIKTELKEVTSTKDVTILHSLYEFVDTRRGVITVYKDLEKPSPTFYGAIGNNTPLWWAIVQVLEQFKNVPEKEKVLVKVFTDGDNNERYNYRTICKDLIKDLNTKNFTITFVATEQDMGKIISDMDLDNSNTLAVENSGEGFRTAYAAALDATIEYSKKVVKGEDVTLGFYKKLI